MPSLGASLRLLAVLVVALPLLLAPGAAGAQGVIVVEPPECDPICPEPIFVGDQLEIRSHDVDVLIADGVAETRIDQTFHNPNDWTAEGTYLLPVPAGAAIGEFTMWVDGEPIEAKLLDAAEARQVYEEIVRNLRDPALLEFAGQGLVRASVFPIPPGEDRRVEIAYGEILSAENGLTHYRYGLDAERLTTVPLERASISIEIQSETPLRAVYSPSHDVVVDRDGERRAVVGWEASDVRPDADFDLFFSASPDPIGAHLVTEIDPVTGEAYVLMVASPGIEAADETVAKDVVVIIDTSGSMEGEKIEQARTALVSVLEQLNPNDRFAVISFSTGVRPYADGLTPASERSDAIAWAKQLAAEGGTDINRALLEAFATVEQDRPTMVIFLTDGLPTEGETDIPDIMENAEESAPDNVRLFAFGVGDDVDTLLLDGLADAHRGRSTYVRPGEPLDEAVSAFYAGISAPVLSDLEIDWGGIRVEDISPDPLPDLFAGTQLVVLGRFAEGEAGVTTVTLSGNVNSEARSFTFPEQRFGGAAADDDGWLGRLWATRRIGHLLNQIRLHGENPELVESVVDLSIRFGIVTPYTSYLLTEDDILSAAGRERAVDQARAQAAQPAPSSGAAAVTVAQETGDMAIADASGGIPTDIVTASGETIETGGRITHAAGRAFLLRDGVWTDTAFDGASMEATEVAFLSEAYFALLAERPELAEAFALGEQVIVVAGDEAWEITAS